MISWRTRPDGRVEVYHAGAWRIPELPGPDAATERVRGYRPLVTSAARKHRIPRAWIFGVMYAESGGKPNEVSPAGARGLMQIMPCTAKLYHVPADQLFDPSTSVYLGTRILADLRRSPPKFGLPEVASMYNAGPAKGGPKPSADSPWGYKEDPGYISRVVSAVNYFFSSEAAPGSGAAPVLLAGMTGAALYYLATR